MHNVARMEISHGLGNLLGQVNALLHGERFGPGVDVFVECGATTEPGGGEGREGEERGGRGVGGAH